MAGVACINCYELPPRCSHGLGGVGAAGCTGWNHDPEEHRLANGNYGAAFRQALPYEIHTLDGLHIDALRKRGQDGAIAPVRTAEQADLTAALADNTMAFAQADVMMALMVEFPEEHVGIARNFNRLISGLTVAQTHQAALYFPQIRDAKAALKEQAEKEGGGTATTLAFEQKHLPRATLLQEIIDAIVKGQRPERNELEMLSVASGKKYIPFKRSTKVTCAEDLMLGGHLFVSVMTTVVKEAPTVYFDLMREIALVSKTHSPVFAQEYFDAILRKLDEGVAANLVSFFARGEQNRVLRALETSLAWKGKPVGNGGGNGGGAPNPNPNPNPNPAPSGQRNGKPYVKFGAVTQPLGGTSSNYLATPCKNFHAIPQRPCLHGMPAGHAQEGLCAFTH
jgi:hypothetical protein